MSCAHFLFRPLYEQTACQTGNKKSAGVLKIPPVLLPQRLKFIDLPLLFLLLIFFSILSKKEQVCEFFC